MVGIYLREFDCTYCGQSFTLEESDLILPEPRLCDDCLKRLLHLSNDQLVHEEIGEDNLKVLRGYQKQCQLNELIEIRESTRQKYT